MGYVPFGLHGSEEGVLKVVCMLLPLRLYTISAT